MKDVFDKYLNKDDIAHFFKYRLFSLYFWKRVWYNQVVTRIFPRNRWFTNWVPRQFTDVDYLMEQAVFRSLIFFWENDGGEKSMRYQWDRKLDEWDDLEVISRQKEVYELMLAAYNWAKVRDAKFDDANFEDEKKFKEEDTNHLLNIIAYRGYLWT